MIEAHAFSSIQAIERDAWNECFPDALEDWDYIVAVEKAGIEGFNWRYLTLFEGPTLIAVATAFTTCYRLDTTVQGVGKRFTEALNRVLPGLMQLPLYAIGSPVTEQCRAGTARHITPSQRPALLGRLLSLAQQDARALGIGLMAVKDVPSHDDDWANSCKGAGFQSMPSLPSALLPVPFDSVDGYLESLGKSTRKDMRRKWRAPGPQVEWRSHIDDVLPDVMRLYEASLARSDLQWERLPPAYFTGILQQLGDRALCALYRIDVSLVAFNLVLLDEHRLIDKFFGHDLALTREYNLYFRSWLVNVDYCIRNGIGLYECGQAGYASKIRLGCTFEGNTLFFRHRNRLINNALKLVKLFIRPDRHDPAMAAAISES